MVIHDILGIIWRGCFWVMDKFFSHDGDADGGW